nr:EAL domain-containing protein [uncultured Roseateles sp.]
MSDPGGPDASAPRGAWLAVALAASLLAGLLWSLRAQLPLLDRIDRITVDGQLQWRGPLRPSEKAGLLLISIDDVSLRRLGSIAPDRRQLAQAIDRLSVAGARAIALDMLLLDPARPDPAADQALALAMRSAGNVLLPFALPMAPSSEDKARLPASWDAPLDSAYVRHSGGPAQQAVALEPARLVMPIAPLAQAAAALGHVTVLRGPDGAVRFDLPALTFEGEVYPSLALRLAALAMGLDWRQVEMRFGEQVLLGTQALPVDALSRQWLNYYGSAGTFETLSFIDLLDGTVAPSRLKGRVALIGMAALGAGDTFPTPFDAGLPGFERLATVVDNIVSGRALVRPLWAAPAEMLAMLALPLLAVTLIARWPQRRALLGLLVLLALLVGLLQWLLLSRQIFVAPAFPLLSLGLAVLGATALRSGIEQARKRAALQALRASEQRYALAVQGANDGMWDWDIAGAAVYFSPRWLTLMGLSPEQAQTMAAWTQPLDARGRQDFDAALADHLAGRSLQFHHVLNFEQGGAERWLLARGVAVREADRPTRMAGSLTDISEQQQLQRQITFDALHDRLTGLPNRVLFLERLGQLFAAGAEQTGVILIDIDGFRSLNEREGTQAGDEVLREMGRRLAQREGQALNLARLGADRFGLLFTAPLAPDGQDEARLAAWALAQFEAPFRVGEHTLNLGVSIGWAHGAQGRFNATELMNAAELALAHAKASQRGKIHCFDPAEQLIENSRRWLRENIDLALQRQEFRLFYQPLVQLKDQELLGFEALIRWPHPVRGMVMPGDFIPFAEESGQIVPLGRWTLMEAAAQLVRWDAQGFKGEIAVNLSSVQFSVGDLEGDARAVLQVLGEISPRRIKLEVTESMAMANPQRTAVALQNLAALGFKISIDDFGTGYSSLAYLHRFPFDTLKIDRSFVIRLASGREAVEIVRTIVGLAMALDKQVLAEGVEEPAQAQLLQELGVHVGQGWLFAKALPADQAQQLIRDGIKPAR